MKLFKTIAATTAVITCCIGNAVPTKASTLVDLSRGTMTLINDGNPHGYIVQGARTWKTYTPDQDYAYPIKGAGPGVRQTHQLSRSDHQGFANIFYQADRNGDTFRNAVYD